MKQVGLCLDEQTLKQALNLFKESKSMLIANVDSIGTGTVRRFISVMWGFLHVVLQVFLRFFLLLLHDSSDVRYE